MTDQKQKFEIQKIYLKDVSYESPKTPQVFTQPWNPKTDVHIQTDSRNLEKDSFEVVLSVTVTAIQEENTVFLIEIKQAGIFSISGFSKEQHDQLMGSYCPNILFPFAREAVADMVSRGGFPQLLLNPVNFEALYQQHLQAIKEQQQNPPSVKH